jgi:hypothetical protein
METNINPRFKVTFVSASSHEETLDMEEFKERFMDSRWYLFMVDGKAFHSCAQLCWFASQNGCQDQEFIEVTALRKLAGG